MNNKRKYTSGFLKPVPTVAILFLLLLFRIPVSNAQEVISSAGKEHRNASLSVSWTLGEVAVHTFATESHVLTQGFQQPNITVVSVEDLLNVDYMIHVFPNPTRDLVNLHIDLQDTAGMFYRVFDYAGNLIIQEQLDGKNTQINLETLKPALYGIQVWNKQQAIKTFKIIKTQ